MDRTSPSGLARWAVWADKIANSTALRDYAADRGALFTPYYGDDAHGRADGMVRQNAWLLYDAGKAAKSPDEVGIERPQSQAPSQRR